MDAFRHKPDYRTGAGECVSLATLYAAALFIVAEVPLHDIYLMATPLHSQNFIDLRGGVLTNNRRLVTKNMWFNGTALSAQARRALENERVTIVAHETGYIHTVYEDATIDRSRYEHFAARLHEYLHVPLSAEILGSFLRHSRDLQKCFQLRWRLHGHDSYIAIEKAFSYEHGTSYSVTDNTRDKLMAEIEDEEFEPCPLPSRIVLDDLEAFITNDAVDIQNPGDIDRLKGQFASDCLNAEIAIETLLRFCRVKPRLPDPGSKQFATAEEPLGIHVDMGRDAIVRRLEEVRERNRMADMAFYAYRDLETAEWAPFLLAAVHRNPVSREATAGLDLKDAEAQIRAMADESIYDGPTRLAQPDEVWNYGRGDGLEKAILMANLVRSRFADEDITIETDEGLARLRTASLTMEFASAKKFCRQAIPVP